jgi:malonyl-CoA decarboxylase
MPGFISNLLRVLGGGRGEDMRFLCQQLLSERGEASQTVLADKIIQTYAAMTPAKRRGFFGMLNRDFSPDEAAIRRAAAEYEKTPSPQSLAALSATVEAPRQELFRRINTAPKGTETLVTLRGDLHTLTPEDGEFSAVDADLKHLMRSWFNRGFLRLERISWQTSAIVLEKLIRYESVHEINGWPDLRRRLDADRRCFAFFHPALTNEPIIFVEVALANGLAGNLEPLLDIQAPVLAPEKADTAIFYSINNCLRGLRGVAFGNFLIKQVVTELSAEFPNLRTYGTLSPLPRFARALRDAGNSDGFTHDRVSRLIADFAPKLTAAARRRDPVEALFALLERPVDHRDALAAPLERLAFVYLAKARDKGKLYDPVALFHLANGARLEQINAFGNLRPYGLEASFGVTVNYRYLPEDLEENHERFVRGGQIRVSPHLFREHRKIAEAWGPERSKASRRSMA